MSNTKKTAMAEDGEIERLVNAIKKACPEAATKATEIIAHRGFEEADYANYSWLEAFAATTDSSLKSKNENEARSHMRLMSLELSKGSDPVKRAIEVAYIENLMFKFSDAEKKWAWKSFPANIKMAYESIWGDPFSRKNK